MTLPSSGVSRLVTDMAMFPIMWEETSSLDQLSDLSPYSMAEIEEYLFRNHYHLCLEEKPTTFSVSGPHAQKQDVKRRYWVFEARDRATQQQWFVLVGTGESPFRSGEKMKRWAYAKTNDDYLSPDEFLDEEYRDQAVADARSR